jgi:hypothetical protein
MSTPNTVIDSIPPPDTIRAMIAERIREASILRGLLRIAEQRERTAKIKCRDRAFAPKGGHRGQ